MRNCCRKLLPIFGFCLLAVTGAGCTSPSWGSLAWWKKEDAEDQMPLVQSPAKRLEDMRTLAEQAPKMEPAEQERVSLQLAQAMRTELDPAMRVQIVQTLGAFSTTPAEGILFYALKDSDGDVRVAACEAWGRRQSPDRVRLLSETLSTDTDVDVRLAAARALGNTKDPAAVVGLAVALDDPNPALQHRAVRSLEEVSDRQFGNDVEAWREFVQGRDPPKNESVAQRPGRIF